MHNFLITLFQSDSARFAISHMITKKTYEKGTVVIHPDTINNDLFFLEKGVARGYYHHENRRNQEITSWIVAEGHFVAVPHSFFGRKPSSETVHLLEDSVAYSISYYDLEMLAQNHLEIAAVKSRLVEKYLIRYDERLQALRSTSALKRLLFFEEHYRELLNRIPQKYIASFLGLTPQTLSKLRSERVRKV